MEKGYVIGAAIAYIMFIALTAWLIMIGLDAINVSVSYIGTVILLVAARFTYVLIKGNIVNE